MEIAGARALVTGAGSGIGRATAQALAAAGAAVVVADIDARGGNETVRAIVAARGAAAVVVGDVRTPDGVEALFGRAERAFGGLEIVHNNAGIVCGEPSWPETPPDRIAAVIATNVAGVMLGTRRAVVGLAGRPGVVIYTASTAGLSPLPYDPVYAGTKAAVIYFTRSCAALARSHGVRVNAVLPGMVDTPIVNKTGDGVRPATWLGPALAAVKLLRPEQIADAVLALIRDESKAGETVIVTNETANEAGASA